jgi:hypothetical protein
MKLHDILAVQLTRLYPDLKQYQISRILEKYIPAVLNELCRGLIRPANDNNEISFDCSSMRSRAGQLKFRNQTTYVFEFMSRTPVTRLIDVKFSGNIGRLSRVVMNEMYKEQIMNEILEMSC